MSSSDLARFVPFSAARIPGIVHPEGTQHPVTREVVGNRADVAAVINNHARRRTLVEYGVQRYAGNGKVKVKITYLETAAERAAALACGAHGHRPRWRTPVIVASVIAVAVLLGWGVLAIVSAIMQSLLVVIAVIAGLVFLSGVVVRHTCRGMHCDGCS